MRILEMSSCVVVGKNLFGWTPRMALEVLIVAVLSFLILNPSSGVSAQANASAPSPATAPAYAPAPSPAQAFEIRYNFSWIPREQEALQDMLEEWNKTNNDISSLLVGWSATDPTPCGYTIWVGVMCSLRLLNTTDNNATTPKTRTYSAEIYIIGLAITGSGLNGILPPAIGNLTNLVFIIFSENPGISGPIPSTFSNLKQIQSLDLHGNNFNETIPTEIGNLQNLYLMDMSNNNLTGPIPSTLSNMTQLTFLDLSGNNLNGNIPGYGGGGLGLGNLSNLLSLHLMENNLTGGLPDFRNVAGLEYVNVSHNHLSDPVVVSSHFNASARRPLQLLDLSFNSFTGPFPDLATLSSGLKQLSLSYNQFSSTTVPPWLSNFTNLMSLGLANMNLIGPIPAFLFQFQDLQTLELANNRFNGTLDLSNVGSTNLELVNLTANDITSVKYNDDLLSSQIVRVPLDGNPFCTAMENQDMTLEKYFFCNNSTGSVTVIDHYRTAIIATSVCVSAVFLLVAVVAIFFCMRHRRQSQAYYQQIQEEFARNHVQPTLYAYSELRSATREFHPDMKLGQGAFGVVYKGVQADGTELAVKHLTGKSQQGLDEFLNEVVLITGVRHRNLVKLKGCCLKDDRRLLVYEFVENNNLDEVLFGGVGGHDLNWGVRSDICLGVAQGLHYLHESTEPRIIHRDVKAPNILLDKNLHPKIADFGLARLFQDAQSHVSTLHIAGTMGYMAPEYASRGQLTEKADVYSFGVVVLEVVSGRRNIDPKLDQENIYLVELARRLQEEGNLLRLVDPTMNIAGCEEQVQRVLNVGLLCVQSEGPRRPSMAKVVSMLKGEIEPGVVKRQPQCDREYDSFLAAAQSGSTLTMTTIAEREEIAEDNKPLLINPTSSGSTGSSTRQASGSIELATISPR